MKSRFRPSTRRQRRVILALFMISIVLTCSGQGKISRTPKPTPAEPVANTNPKPIKKQKKQAAKPTGWRNEETYTAPSIPDYPEVSHDSMTSSSRMTPNKLCNLGDDYFYGDGKVDTNYDLAAYWYYQSAMEGHEIAQLNLGMLYEKGLGVDKNLESAAYWYWQSAQQGNAIAQCNVGNCYRFGWGVNVDISQAKYWYTLSAEQGDSEAQRNLHNLMISR